MWSKSKKTLEEKLAPCLAKKIEYVMETGHKVPWGLSAKVEIKYLGEPIACFREGIDYLVGHYEFQERSMLSEITWTKEETHQLFLKVQKQLWQEQNYTSSMFFKGMVEYFSLPIADALKHEQWMIRLFAILDRRCGKRTLRKLCQEINTYPDLLKEFYMIRLSNEKIPYGKNEKGEIFIREKNEYMNPNRKRWDSGFDDYDEEFFYYESVAINECGLILFYEWDGINGKNELGIPRTKICKKNSDMLMVTIESDPKVVGEIPSQIGKKDIEDVKNYISSNKDLLLKIWNTPLDKTEDCLEIVETLTQGGYRGDI